MFRRKGAEMRNMVIGREKNNYMKYVYKILVAVAVIGLINACSMSESKIKSIVDREIGPDLIVEKARLELDKQLGKQHSKLKSSLLDMVADRIEIEYTEIIVEGRRARVKVQAKVPKLEDLGALFSEARNLPREKILEMSAQELIKEINRSSRRPASQNDLRVEHYEFFVDFEKNKEWIANNDQLKRAYSKKNLIPYVNY
jgi:hypothetical protein